MTKAMIEKKEYSNLPTENDLNVINYYANKVYNSGLIPKSLIGGDDSKEQLLAKISIVFLKGYELEISPMQSLAEIGVINGKPIMSSKLMLALIYRNVPSAELNYAEMSPKSCILRARRHPSHQFTTFEYTFDEAIKAGLTQRNPTWNKFPRQMLKWRTVANMARTLFPDVIMGCYLPSELPVDDTDTTFGNVEDLKLTEEEEEKVSKVPIKETIDADFVPIQDIMDDNTLGMDMKLKLDLPEKKEKPKPKVSFTSKPKETVNKSTKKISVSVKKPNISSAMNKIKNISKIKKISKKTTKPKKISMKKSTKKISMKKSTKKISMKKSTKKVKLNLGKKKSTKKKSDLSGFKDPDFYFSSPESDKINSDLPWNLLKRIISPKVNTDEKNIFNIKICKYFKDFMDEASPSDTIGNVLLESYHQYCEVDLHTLPDNVEAQFYEEINSIINKIIEYLKSLTSKESTKFRLLNGIFKATQLEKKYSDWIVGFLESRELISIDGQTIIINI